MFGLGVPLTLVLLIGVYRFLRATNLPGQSQGLRLLARRVVKKPRKAPELVPLGQGGLQGVFGVVASKD
jgi:hypothetical protein